MSEQGPATETGAGQEMKFQAEVQQLLHILVHSLYTQKEIFLRELISNAVDALDKMRFLQLTEKAGEELPLEVRLECDETRGRLTISDTGIGMTREELIENIGTIARSGTAQFLKQLSEESRKASALIGQFGVGFYSVFMVAERVRLVTRSWKPGSRAVLWESDGLGTYSVAEHAETSRGTRIEIELKPDELEFAKPARVREIVKTHSHYLSYPIKLAGDTINEVAAPWMRPKSAISKEEYDEFYKFISGGDEAPLSTLHFSLDTPVQLHALLYFPARSFERLGFGRTDSKLALHSRRVLIQAECKDLLPDYLRFVRGVVDSEDLPLNVSRESFQQNKVVQNIRRQLVRKILAHLAELADKEPEPYKKFFHEFGPHLKEGYQTDFDHRDKLVSLLRWNSTKVSDGSPSVSLSEYVSRMKEDQSQIYTLSGQDRATLLKSPHLEMFREKQLEVLLLTDPLDDLIVSQMREYDGKGFRAADEAGLELKIEAGADESLAIRGKLARLIEAMKKILGDRVLDVRESKRLVESPAALVNPQEGATAGIQKLLSLVNKDFVMSKRILEINGKSQIVRNLAELLHRDAESKLVEQATHQLLDNVLLLEGLPVSPEQMVPRIQQLIEELTSEKTRSP
jgi:molecular chaperone HtpG